MDDYKCEKYKDDPFAGCHKDFCRCVKESMRDYKKNVRDNNVSTSIAFFEKNNIPFKSTEIENIVTTEYWGEKFYISLKTFKFKKEGSTEWEEKKRKILTPETILNFGKYKGIKCSEVLINDKSYFSWVHKKTDLLINNEIYNQIK